MADPWLTTALAATIWSSAIPNATVPTPKDYSLNYALVRTATHMNCPSKDFVVFWDCARPIILYGPRFNELHFLTLAKEGNYIQALVVGGGVNNNEAWARWQAVDKLN
jgi:hypothetical protein